MKQAEFQEKIKWIDGMNYCAVNADGLILQFVEKPILVDKKYWDSRWVRYVGHLDSQVENPEKWLFIK